MADWNLTLCVHGLLSEDVLQFSWHIGQVLTMPFFFASSAIYPVSIMPGWLKVIEHGNPPTYEVDALRALMLSGGTSSFGLALDFGVLWR